MLLTMPLSCRACALSPIPAPSSQNSLSCLGTARLILGSSCSPAAACPRSTGISAFKQPRLHPPPLRSLCHPVLFCRKSGKCPDRAAGESPSHSSEQPRSNPQLCLLQPFHCCRAAVQLIQASPCCCQVRGSYQSKGIPLETRRSHHVPVPSRSHWRCPN